MYMYTLTYHAITIKMITTTHNSTTKASTAPDIPPIRAVGKVGGSVVTGTVSDAEDDAVVVVVTKEGGVDVTSDVVVVVEIEFVDKAEVVEVKVEVDSVEVGIIVDIEVEVVVVVVESKAGVGLTPRDDTIVGVTEGEMEIVKTDDTDTAGVDG